MGEKDLADIHVDPHDDLPDFGLGLAAEEARIGEWIEEAVLVEKFTLLRVELVEFGLFLSQEFFDLGLSAQVISDPDIDH
jgi:hypothetical protein